MLRLQPAEFLECGLFGYFVAAHLFLETGGKEQHDGQLMQSPMMVVVVSEPFVVEEDVDRE